MKHLKDNSNTSISNESSNIGLMSKFFSTIYMLPYSISLILTTVEMSVFMNNSTKNINLIYIAVSITFIALMMLAYNISKKLRISKGTLNVEKLTVVTISLYIFISFLIIMITLLIASVCSVFIDLG